MFGELLGRADAVLVVFVHGGTGFLGEIGSASLAAHGGPHHPGKPGKNPESDPDPVVSRAAVIGQETLRSHRGLT